MLGMAEAGVSILASPGTSDDTTVSDGAASKPKRKPPRKGTRKGVTVEGITSKGALLEMQRVYRQPSHDDATHGEKYYRYVLRTNPGKFLEGMRKEEAAQRSETDEAKAHAAEFERLKAAAVEYDEFKASAKAELAGALLKARTEVAALREELAGKIAVLEADLTAARSRIAELELLVPKPEEDEYAHPNIQRLEELHRRLIRE
jgi:hypothetical protein